MGIEDKPLKPRNKGGNPNWRKGVSGNPGGRTKESIRESRDLRAALELEGSAVHEALMALVRQRNATAVIYAHRQLVGEPTQTVRQVGPDFSQLTDEEMCAGLALSERLYANSAARNVAGGDGSEEPG